MSLREISEVPFPSVSICHDINSWKWPGIVNAIARLDKNNTIRKFILNDGLLHYIYESLGIQMKRFGILAIKATKKVEKVNHATSKVFMESLFPKDLQNVGRLIHFIAYSVGDSIKIEHFVNEVIDLHYYLKMINLSAQETGLRAQEIICAWYTSRFNATELCIHWSNDNDNRVRYEIQIKWLHIQ